MTTPRHGGTGTLPLDPEMERRRLEASAVVASSVSRGHVRRAEARIERRVTRREIFFVIVTMIVLAILVWYFQEQLNQRDRDLASTRSQDATTISDLRAQLTTLDGQYNSNRKVIEELEKKLVKLGVNPTTLPTIPPVATLPTTGSTAHPGSSSIAQPTAHPTVTTTRVVTAPPTHPPTSKPPTTLHPSPTPTPTPPLLSIGPIVIPPINLGPIHLG